MDNKEVKQKFSVLIRKLNAMDRQAVRHLEDYIRKAFPETQGKLTAMMVEANDEQLEKFTRWLERALQKGNLLDYGIDYTLKGFTAVKPGLYDSSMVKEIMGHKDEADEPTEWDKRIELARADTEFSEWMDEYLARHNYAGNMLGLMVGMHDAWVASRERMK